MASQSKPLIALVDSDAKMAGVEFSTLYLADQIDRTRFDCIVICPQDGDLPEKCRARNINVAIVPRPAMLSSSAQIGSFYVPNIFAWIFNVFLLLITTRRYARYFRANNIGLVCTKGLYAHFYAGISARLCHIPCVIHMQDLLSKRARGLYILVFGNFAARFSHHVIADGSTIKKQLAPFLGAGQLTIIHNAVDLNQFSDEVNGDDIRHEWSIQADEILIGNVARLTAWKGQDYLIKAFAQIARDIPQTKLVLVGSPVFDGDKFENDLRHLTHTLGLEARIIFAGFRWDLPQVLAAMDVFVHASIQKDTSPLAVVSAMASGKAIVTTNVEGVAELFVPEQEAILVQPGDTDDMARGLRTILLDTKRREELGRAAREKAERELSVETFARRCEEVFLNVLSSTQGNLHMLNTPMA